MAITRKLINVKLTVQSTQICAVDRPTIYGTVRTRAIDALLDEVIEDILL